MFVYKSSTRVSDSRGLKLRHGRNNIANNGKRFQIAPSQGTYWCNSSKPPCSFCFSFEEWYPLKKSDQAIYKFIMLLWFICVSSCCANFPYFQLKIWGIFNLYYTTDILFYLYRWEENERWLKQLQIWKCCYSNRWITAIFERKFSSELYVPQCSQKIEPICFDLTTILGKKGIQGPTVWN